MGLFSKKYCDICGGDMGIIIDNKAADGNFCHNCAHKLSPFFHGARNATLRQIQEQIMYREQNKQQLGLFNPSKTLGFKTKVYLDPGHNCFVVTKSSNYKNDNADIINLSQVTGAKTEVKEHKTELYMKDAQGNRQSYNPKQYEYSYEIFVVINVNSPYFNEIKFEVTDTPVKMKGSPEYMKYQNEADMIVAAVTGRQMPVNNMGMNGMNGAANGMGGIGAAVAGVAGAAGLAGIAGALLGNQNAAQQQNMMNNQAYGQQNMMNNQAYGQQGMMNNQAYGQQGMMNNQAYGQQGMMNNQAYGQQNMNMMGNQAFGAQWQCPNCGMTNMGNVCQSCGMQKPF